MASNPQTEHLTNPPFLGGLSAQAFLEQYWQKQHLYIQNAFPDQIECLDPNDLAGFSLEENIESRILIEKSAHDWEVLHGPFSDNAFASLPKSHWTLLVQAVDHYFPDFASLLDQFNFLPQWRIDDIMMSYATTGGNVGPHYDYYDVFLIQISGQRHWKVGQLCSDNSPLIDNVPVRILSQFDTVAEHIVNPGDVLYLPPGVAHHGVALDDNCITLSVGFRAPSSADALSEYSHYLAEQLQGQHRYSDGELSARSQQDHHSGIISDNDVARMKAHLLNHFANDANIKRWMAEHFSLPKYEDAAQMDCDFTETDVVQLIESGIPFQRDEASRLSLISDNGVLSLFINGSNIGTSECNPLLIHTLSASRVIDSSKLLPFTDSAPDISLITRLATQGLFYFPDDEQ